MKHSTRARPRRGVSTETREHVLRRDGGCVLARFEPDHVCLGGLEVHHRKLRRHGDHSAENLAALCVAGHLWVHEHCAVAYAHGLLLHSWDYVTELDSL